MNIGGAGAATFYGVNMNEYGDTGVGSMMALMTEQEPGNESIMSTMTMTIPSSAFSSYSHAGQVEGLLSAAAATMFNQGGHHHHHQKHLVGGHFPPQEQLVMNEQAAVISDSSLSSVKTEVCSNQLDYHRKTSGGGGGRSCCPQPSLMARAPHHHHQQQHHQQHHQQHQQEASRMVTSLEVDIDSACSSNPNDSIDALKSKIACHPHYPQLLAAYMDCQKVGAPPEVVTVLDEIIQENQLGRHSGTMDIGVDPELDQFMEAYCQMLIKYHLELTKPFKEARTFLNKMETQLNCLSKGVIRSFPSGYCDEREDGGGSSEEEFSCGEIDVHEVDPRAEDRELKDQLLRKYSGYFSSLKQEFLKKKKKGKLPKEARQKLLEWWNVHYKWPYPSETDKVALAESTGLDQKQINNWFINQRKRHWKPSEDMQFVVMDSLNPHGASFYMDGAEC